MTNSTVIVLVEDDPADEFLTKRVFARPQFGNPLVVCRDGAAAIDYFYGDGAVTRLDGRPHLILLDLALPKVSGLQVLTRLQAEPTTNLFPVVVMTSSDDFGDYDQALQQGAKSFVRKPISINTFIEVTARIGLDWLNLNERAPVSP